MIESTLQSELEGLTDFRRDLHRHPELSGVESSTARRVEAFLRACGPTRVVSGLGGHGLAFVFEGAKPGPTVLLRCELDALPIQEINAFEHRSSIDGVSHKCGHDGHMAILAGVGKIVAAAGLPAGKLILLYQPAEETGAGALQVVADPRFEELAPDHVYSLHNLPGFPEGSVLVHAGTFACASRGMVIDLEGKTSHAAWPEDGTSPALALSRIMVGLTELSASPAFGGEFATVTLIHARMGEEAFGTMPGAARLLITLRTEKNEVMETLAREATGLVRGEAEREGLKLDIGWADEFVASVNDATACDRIREAAGKVGAPVIEMSGPMRASEDFGHFTARVPGAMFGLGAGEASPQLHNPDYDFPDGLLVPGVKMFWEIVRGLVG